MAATKQTKYTIVFLLKKEYSKLNEQKNSGWRTFISEKRN
jgi:hypothetical protein